MATNPSIAAANAAQLSKLQSDFGKLVLNSAENVIQEFKEKTLRHLGDLWTTSNLNTQDSFRRWVQTQPDATNKVKRLDLCLRLIAEGNFDYELTAESSSDEDEFGLEEVELETVGDTDEHLAPASYLSVVSNNLPSYTPPAQLGMFQRAGNYLSTWLPHTPPATPPQALERKRPRNDSPGSPTHSAVLTEAQTRAAQLERDNALLASAPARPEVARNLFATQESFAAPMVVAVPNLEEQEARRLQELETARLQEQQEALRLQQLEVVRLQAEQEARRLQEEQEARLQMERKAQEAAHLREQQEQKARLQAEQAARIAAERELAQQLQLAREQENIAFQFKQQQEAAFRATQEAAQREAVRLAAARQAMLDFGC